MGSNNGPVFRTHKSANIIARLHVILESDGKNNITLKTALGGWGKYMHKWHGILDHYTTFKTHGVPGCASEMIVTHPYWDEESERQFEILKQKLKGRGYTVALRDATLSPGVGCKQLLVMASGVPVDEVLSLPFRFLHYRSCEPGGVVGNQPILYCETL